MLIGVRGGWAILETLVIGDAERADQRKQWNLYIRSLIGQRTM
jgi:hypothetical protein